MSTYAWIKTEVFEHEDSPPNTYYIRLRFAHDGHRVETFHVRKHVVAEDMLRVRVIADNGAIAEVVVPDYEYPFTVRLPSALLTKEH